MAGHLHKAVINGAGEFTITSLGNSTVERSYNSSIGLNIYDFQKSSPGIAPRPYPDVFWTPGAKEDVYISNDDWTIYYAEIDWELFLMYQMVLFKKGYAYEGNMLDYVKSYIDDMYVGQPPTGNPLTLVLEKHGWAKVTANYYPDGALSPNGMTYTMSTSIQPQADLLQGKPGSGLTPDQYVRYNEMREKRLREKLKQ